MRWVKAADALDAYLKCAMELAAGNREFAVAERQLEAKARGDGHARSGLFSRAIRAELSEDAGRNDGVAIS